jgi:hypothetical protein
MTKQERSYIIGLIVVAFLSFFVLGETAVFAWLLPHEAGRPNLAMVLMVFIMSLHLLVIFLILFTFFRWRVPGRLFLTALNIVLLMNFPFGTVLGVYYLWKIDKKTVLNTAMIEQSGESREAK